MLSGKYRSRESSQFPSILMTVVTSYCVHVIRNFSPGSALCVNWLKCREEITCVCKNCRQPPPPLPKKKARGAKTLEEIRPTGVLQGCSWKPANDWEVTLCQPQVHTGTTLHVQHCDAKTPISLYFLQSFTSIYQQTHKTTAWKNICISSCGSLSGQLPSRERRAKPAQDKNKWL